MDWSSPNRGRHDFDLQVRHGGLVPSLWVSHRPSNEAEARVPRVEALEAILAKGTAGSIAPRKR